MPPLGPDSFTDVEIRGMHLTDPNLIVPCCLPLDEWPPGFRTAAPSPLQRAAW
jgi:hypothetical protein